VLEDVVGVEPSADAKESERSGITSHKERKNTVTRGRRGKESIL